MIVVYVLVDVYKRQLLKEHNKYYLPNGCGHRNLQAMNTIQRFGPRLSEICLTLCGLFQSETSDYLEGHKKNKINQQIISEKIS